MRARAATLSFALAILTALGVPKASARAAGPVGPDDPAPVAGPATERERAT